MISAQKTCLLCQRSSPVIRGHLHIQMGISIPPPFCVKEEGRLSKRRGAVYLVISTIAESIGSTPPSAPRCNHSTPRFRSFTRPAAGMLPLIASSDSVPGVRAKLKKAA